MMSVPPDRALAAVAAVALGLVLFYLAMPRLVRPAMRAMLAPRYRLRVRGLEHIPADGPALLAINHVTWIDGFVLAASCPRRVHCLVNSTYIDLPIIRTLARHVGLIPIPTTGPRAQRAAIEAGRAALDRGLVLAIFPEAQLSRTGLTGPFYRGLEVILQGREHVPVIPVFFDNLWGSLFSFSRGRFLLKRPEGLRRTIGVAYGPPVPPPATVFAVRQGVLAAGVRAAELRTAPIRPLETLDPEGPRLEHAELGLLAASAADFARNGIRQVGRKPGTLGHPIPGVALRAVDADGRPLPPDVPGRLQALLPGREDWIDVGRSGSLDRDGFVSAACP